MAVNHSGPTGDAAPTQPVDPLDATARIGGGALVRSSAVEVVDSPRITQLDKAIRADASRRGELLRQFWSAVTESGTPLVERADDVAEGCVVTFLWRGDPDTAAVLVLANRVTDRRDLSRSAMRSLAGTDVWHLSYRMDDDWQATYQLAPNTPPLPPSRVSGTAAGPNRAGAGDRAGQPFDDLIAQARPDPLARLAMPSIWGGPAMSAAILPTARQRPEWTPRAAQALDARGRVTRHRRPISGGTETVWVYEPAEQSTPLPLLLLLDGETWAETIDLAAALDHLIADGTIPPVLVVMPQAPGGAERTRRFATNLEFVLDLRTAMLPWISHRFRISSDPDRRILAGQSMGGLAAVWAATRAPDQFGVALAQSGSFWWPSHEPTDPASQSLTALLAGEPMHPVKVRLAVGRREVLLIEPTRRLQRVLVDRGYDSVLHEYNGGHDVLWWRTALTEALVDVLAPVDHDGA